MTFGIVRAIGALTITLAAISFVVVYRAIESGMWIAFEWLYIANFLYYGVAVTIAGLVIGIATLSGKKWTRKGNVVFQS